MQYAIPPPWRGGGSASLPGTNCIQVASADLYGDGKPDYVLYRASTRQTAIVYMNNNVVIGAAFGPTLPAGWTLAAP